MKNDRSRGGVHLWEPAPVWEAAPPGTNHRPLSGAQRAAQDAELRRRVQAYKDRRDQERERARGIDWGLIGALAIVGGYFLAFVLCAAYILRHSLPALLRLFQ